jgi:hypothetical protein
MKWLWALVVLAFLTGCAGQSTGDTSRSETVEWDPGDPTISPGWIVFWAEVGGYVQTFADLPAAEEHRGEVWVTYGPGVAEVAWISTECGWVRGAPEDE